MLPFLTLLCQKGKSVGRCREVRISPAPTSSSSNGYSLPVLRQIEKTCLSICNMPNLSSLGDHNVDVFPISPMLFPTLTSGPARRNVLTAASEAA